MCPQNVHIQRCHCITVEPSMVVTIEIFGVAFYGELICTSIWDSEVAFIEKCLHVRGGLYEGFHSLCMYCLSSHTYYILIMS